ncbi:SRPBCC domain-containing protein [Flavobacterium supellecticarium]|uniref:SRPBCC domain-containing protein n=1 Tax=Flavobacterium supellecticarium TaxID=2565924 RepID=A0A4S4A0P4_9FLAO|nr:SRPBCC domain-containing protein [Flavobacterium supellecticarium]THF51838.1 SRPBCC domain-containing protein [Flavobacterium supellecticarium]
MKILQFKIEIKASPATVWNALWEISNYNQWARVFSEGSTAVSDWKEGSSILFIDDHQNGMYSIINQMVPNELMSFKHIGILKNGKEEPLDEESKKWTGAMENYILIDLKDATQLEVSMDIPEDFEDYFNLKFPQALEIVKKIAENNL